MGWTVPTFGITVPGVRTTPMRETIRDGDYDSRTRPREVLVPGARRRRAGPAAAAQEAGQRCGSAPKRGSGALSMTACSASYDEAGTQQVELGAPVHLPLDQLELGDLALGLAVRPGLHDRRGDGVLVGTDAGGERGQRALHGTIDPGVEIPALAA